MSSTNNNNDNSNPNTTPPVCMWDIDDWMERNAGELLDDNYHNGEGICYGMSLAWLQRVLQNRNSETKLSISRKPTVAEAVNYQTCNDLYIERIHSRFVVIPPLIMTIAASVVYYFHRIPLYIILGALSFILVVIILIDGYTEYGPVVTKEALTLSLIHI